MVDLAEIQAAYYMVAATGVLVAAIYYVLNMRATQRNMKMNLETRQAQLLMSILNRWTETEYNKKWQTTLWNINWTDYDDKMKKYPWGSPEFIDEGTLWNYFESIGILLEEGLIDANMLSKLIAPDLIQFWEKFSPFLFEMRKRRGFPQLYSKTEYLYNEMKKLRPEWKYQPNKPF
jgi:hypothetical protein